jgi:hypothetical protein
MEMEMALLVGSLPPQQLPKSFAQNLDILMSGSVTAGAATRRRAEKLAGGAGRRRESATVPGDSLFRSQADDRMS